MIELTKVTSTHIAEIGYQPAERELLIVFRGKPVLYAYQGVPSEIYDGLKIAVSKGGYLERHVKGRYTFERRPLWPGGGAAA